MIENIKEILEKHKKWINNDSDGEMADLQGVNLQNADLLKANLLKANFQKAILPIFSRWYVSSILIDDKHIVKIGCKQKSIDEWDYFFNNSDEVFETERDTEEFKRIHSHYLAMKAYLNNMYPNNI